MLGAKAVDLLAGEFLKLRRRGVSRDAEVVLEQGPVHGRFVLAIHDRLQAVFRQKQRRAEPARAVSDDRDVHVFAPRHSPSEQPRRSALVSARMLSNGR